MLSVGIEQNKIFKILVFEEAEAGANGGAFTAVAGVEDKFSAGIFGEPGGIISGTVIDDNTARDFAAHFTDDITDGFFGVKGRNQGYDPIEKGTFPERLPDFIFIKNGDH